nr:S-4TM family putative pore-forming effector [uncultured Sphingomonas sp.]
MTLNAIPTRQNEPQFMQLLRARSEIYRGATLLLIIQFVVTVAVPVVSAVIGLIFPTVRPYVAMVAIAVTLIDIAVLDRTMKRRLKVAALICEEFDCHLLDMPWNRFIAGKHPEHETITSAERNWPHGDDKLLNWYPAVVGLAPMHLARIVCQRTNLWYDATLRERYGNLLLMVAVIIAGGLILAGLVANLPFADFVVTVLAPCAPLLSWALRDAFKQRDAADAQKTARSEAEALWYLAITGGCAENECARLSREFQNTIFQRRVANPLILPFVYNRLRPGMEVDMNLGAESLLRQAGIMVPTPTLER